MAISIPVSGLPPLVVPLGVKEKFEFQNRNAGTTGKELWRIKLSDSPIFPRIVCLDDGSILLHTGTEIIAISPESRKIIWKKKIKDSFFIKQVDDLLIFVQSDNSRLILRDAKTAEEKKTVNISMSPYIVPAVTSNKFIVIQEQYTNQNILRSYDFELNRKWDFILPQKLDNFKFFVFENLIVLATEHSLEGISLEGKSEWKIEEGKLGSIPCRLVSKLSDHQLLVYFFHAEAKDVIIDIRNLSIQPINFPSRTGIVGNPLVIHDTNGDFNLIYVTTPIRPGNHQNEIARMVKVDSHGMLLGEIRDDEEPRDFIADKQGHLFVTYSPTLDHFEKYSIDDYTPTCYLRCFDKNCQELYRFTTDYPISSSLDIGADGVVYLFCKDTLHAIG